MDTVNKQTEEFTRTAREAAQEGAVLLKNEGMMLPVKPTEKVSVFGRCQLDYYRSGTGSGGSVKVPYTTNLLKGLRDRSNVVNEELAGIYEAWIAAHPFDNGGGGWAAEPWHQAEMPIDRALAEKARAVSAKAIVVIGRTAGEEQDNADAPGSLRLTAEEENMLAAVNASFDRVAVILNVSNIIDMSFMDNEWLAGNVKALMYSWQGGMEGGSALAGLILGEAVPSGKLPDTIARRVADYPSTPFYGDRESNCYVEDIYVGYRYFSTFCPEKILYEFGYGLSYTEFSLETIRAEISGDRADLTVRVKNTGDTFSGKEVVQVYYEAPQGKLGQPARQLVAYEKTGLLAPGAVQEVTFALPLNKMKTYDDSGLSGARSAFVMEAGEYHLYVGNSSRENSRVLTYVQEGLRVVELLEEALAPEKSFMRMKPGRVIPGQIDLCQTNPVGTHEAKMQAHEMQIYEIQYEPVPVRTVSLYDRINAALPAVLPQTGNQGIALKEVKDGKASLEDFIAQLSNEELTTLVRGEGMEHPDVTPGTASAFGGVGESLAAYGIPLACTADGPSGIRMSAQATQVPIGTLLAASFNDEMIERLYVLEGEELHRNEVDLLLGPGINIHRSPMNGRNFEYFSEDPLLTGRMAAAIVRGIGRGGAGATVKHFACNNQETARTAADSVVSERALREIYLRGFEIAVKEGGAKALMTSYNPVNGHYTAANYDLNTAILRNQWGYTGIVMTDWWAKMNNVEAGGPASGQNMRDMVRAGNDLYMVVNNYGAEANSAGDDLMASLAAGTLTVGELQRRAYFICRFLMGTQAMGRPVKTTFPSITVMPLDGTDAAVPPVAMVGAAVAVTVPVTMGETVYFKVQTASDYYVFTHMMSEDFNTAQVSCELLMNGKKAANISCRGSEGNWTTQRLFRVALQPGMYCVRVEERKPHLIVDGLRFELIQKM